MIGRPGTWLDVAVAPGPRWARTARGLGRKAQPFLRATQEESLRLRKKHRRKVITMFEQFKHAAIARFFDTDDAKERDLLDKLLRHYEKQERNVCKRSGREDFACCDGH